MTKQNINIDVKDLVCGFGIGLCFSGFWKIGIFLILLMFLAVAIEISKENETK